MITNKEYKYETAFGLIVGPLYIIFGFIQLAVGLGYSSGWTDALYIPKDIIGSLILVLLGAIFLYGVKELNEGTDEGVSFVYVGIFLALLWVVVYLLVMSASALEAYMLKSEDFEEWVPADDMKPGIYLGILPLIGFLAWRHKFSFRGLSKAGV